MPVITRRQIKRVENNLRARRGINPQTLRGFGDITATIPSWDLGTPFGNITSGGQNVAMSTFWDILTGRQGQLKIEATAFAEGMVRLFYGLEPGCTMPPGGIPINANNPQPKFCATSIAGAIERCRINEAQSSLAYAERQLQTRSNDGTPMAPYIKNWYDQYGRNDISYLGGIIQSSRGACGISGQIPSACATGQQWCTSLLKCVAVGECPPSPVGSGTGMTTMMMVGVFGLLAVFLMRR